MRGADKLFLALAVIIIMSLSGYADEAVPLSGNAAYNYGSTSCSGAPCKVGDPYYGCDEPCFCYDLDGDHFGTCESCCAPRTIGYWKQVCKGNTQNPNMAIDVANLPSYLASIKMYSQVFANLQNVQQLCDVLNVKDNSIMIIKAKLQLMGLWLDAASIKLCPDREISLSITSSDTVTQAIQEIESIILNPSSSASEMERAKNIADSLNNGLGLPCVNNILQAGCSSGDFGCSQILATATKVTVTSTSQQTQSSIGNLVVNFYETGSDSCSYNKQIGDVYNTCPALGSCITDAKGSCSVFLTAGQYLAVAKSGPVYISTTVSNNIIDPYSGTQTYNKAEIFLIEYEDGESSSQIPGKKTVIKGSELDIIQPDYLNWEDRVQACPFILSSEDAWLVNILLQLPAGVISVGPLSQSEIVLNDTKVMLFTIAEKPKLTGSAVQDGLDFSVIINAKSYVGDSAKLVKQIVTEVLGDAKTAEQNPLPAQTAERKMELVKERVAAEVIPTSTKQVSEEIGNVPGQNFARFPPAVLVLLLLFAIIIISYFIKKK